MRPDFKIAQKVSIHREVHRKPQASDKFLFQLYCCLAVVELHPLNAVHLALDQDTVNHDVLNIRNLKHCHNDLNNYKHVSPMGEEETFKNIYRIAGFCNIYFYGSNVVADVRRKYCDPWDIARVSAKIIRPKVLTTPYEYCK